MDDHRLNQLADDVHLITTPVRIAADWTGTATTSEAGRHDAKDRNEPHSSSFGLTEPDSGHLIVILATLNLWPGVHCRARSIRVSRHLP